MKLETAPRLASAARRRLFEVIQANPGISVSGAARLAGMYRGPPAIHAERLRSAGLVRVERVGRRRVLFAAALLDATARVAPGILGEPSCRHVARVIVTHPGLRVWEVADLAGMSERAVYHHVKRLVDAGLVQRAPAGGYRGLSASPELVAWFESDRAQAR